MQRTPASIDIVQGDITTLDVEMIVNAANSSLLGGGGVDGAIHAAAGPGLLEECRDLGGALTGEVKVTGGHNLAARYVAHAVGPVWRGGTLGEPELLAACYRRALQQAHRLEVESIAFPCISTGVFGYPPEPAAKVAVNVVRKHIRRFEYPRQVVFCCFSDEDRVLYEELLDAMSNPERQAEPDSATDVEIEDEAPPSAPSGGDTPEETVEFIEWSDFEAIDLRVGTIVQAEVFPEARKPAFRLIVDFGPELGRKRSSAQVTDLYGPQELVGRQVLAVTNFPPKQIGPFSSEVLVTGFVREDGAVVLVGPDQPVPNGTRLA